MPPSQGKPATASVATESKKIRLNILREGGKEVSELSLKEL